MGKQGDGAIRYQVYDRKKIDFLKENSSYIILLGTYTIIVICNTIVFVDFFSHFQVINKIMFFK